MPLFSLSRKLKERRARKAEAERARLKATFDAKHPQDTRGRSYALEPLKAATTRALALEVGR
jgi:hypothetical protein